MEDKKKNNKTINIGGIGGIVLFGGALVTATLVSALAIKARRQRPSSSDASRSPSSEPETVRAPTQLELMMKSNKDRESSKHFSLDSSPLDLQNPSDGITNMKEMKTKPIENLIQNEKQNSGLDNDEIVDSGDGIEDAIFSVAGEDQESTSIYCDSVFEREELANGYEKIPVEECEEQAVVAVKTEVVFQTREEESYAKISVLSAPREDGGEEQKYTMLTDDGNDEQTDDGIENSLVFNEALALVEEYEAIEGLREEDQVVVEEEESIQYQKAKDITVEAAPSQVPLGDDVAAVVEEEEIPIGHVGEDQETVFTNEEASLQEEATKAACVYEIEVEDSPQVQFLEEDKEGDGHDEMTLENREEDMIYETGSANQIVSEQVMGEEEAIDAACVHQIEVEDGPQVQFPEEEKEKDHHDETSLQNCEGDLSNKTGSADEFVREDNQQMEDNSELVVEEEEAIDTACVDSVNVEDILEMADHEVALENVQEIHVREVGQTFSSQEHSSSAVAYIINMKDGLKVAVDDQTVVREDNPPRQLMNKEEKDKETVQEVVEEMITEDELVKKEEKVKEDEILRVQLIEEAKDDDQTAIRDDNPPNDNPPRQLKNKEETAEKVQVEMITEDVLVKKEEKSKEDEIPHVQSIEEDDEEDVTVKNEVSSDGTGDSSIASNGVAIWSDESVQEEPTPETKISNQKIEENMEVDERTLGKEQNVSGHNEMNEEKDNKSALGYRERFMMELAKERKLAAASQPLKLKLRTWSLVVLIWCLCHWYSDLPFPELSLVGSSLFILILVGFRNALRTWSNMSRNIIGFGFKYALNPKRDILSTTTTFL